MRESYVESREGSGSIVSRAEGRKDVEEEKRQGSYNLLSLSPSSSLFSYTGHRRNVPSPPWQYPTAQAGSDSVRFY